MKRRTAQVLQACTSEVHTFLGPWSLPVSERAAVRVHYLILTVAATVSLVAPVQAQRRGHSEGRSSGSYRSPTLHTRSPRGPATRSYRRSGGSRSRSYSPGPRSPSSRSHTSRRPYFDSPRSVDPRTTTPRVTQPRAAPPIGGLDSRGRIKRSESAKAEFMRESGYPHGRPGYIVDHIVPLAAGGKDEPSNMQWQTIGAAKAKDQVECGGHKCGAPPHRR